METAAAVVIVGVCQKPQQQAGHQQEDRESDGFSHEDIFHPRILSGFSQARLLK